MTQRGGKREGAGRKPGYRLRKTAADVLADIEERHPGWSPLQLLAEVANDKTVELTVRLDAAKCLAGFLHPKPKPAEFNPEQVIDFEKRLAEAVTEVKLAAAAKAAELHPGLFGLGERLSRAASRMAGDQVAAILEDDPSAAIEIDDEDEPEAAPPPRQPPSPSFQEPPKVCFTTEQIPYRPLLPPRPQPAETYNPHDNL